MTHPATIHSRRLRCAAFAAACTAALAAGCDRQLDVPIGRFEVRLEADAPTAGDCQEAVTLRFEPVQVAAQAPGSIPQTTTYIGKSTILGKPVADGPRDWECWFTYLSPALAPGTWRVVGEFADATQSCLRDLRTGLPNRVRIDQEDGCVEFDVE